MPLAVDPIPEIKERLRQLILYEVRELAQELAAEALGIDQPRMSDMERGKLDRFSVEKLIRILATVDQRVVISTVNERPGPLGMFKRERRE